MIFSLQGQTSLTKELFENYREHRRCFSGIICLGYLINNNYLFDQTLTPFLGIHNISYFGALSYAALIFCGAIYNKINIYTAIAYLFCSAHLLLYQPLLFAFINQHSINSFLLALLGISCFILTTRPIFTMPFILLSFISAYGSFVFLSHSNLNNNTLLNAAYLITSAILFYVVLVQKSAFIASKFKKAELLAHAIAHEMRTPLAAISLNSQAALSKSDTSIKTELHDIQACAKQANAHINLMLNNINKPINYSRETIDCLNIVTSAINEYPFVDDERELVECDIKTFAFSGNPFLFRQILFNLFKNALFQIKKSRKGTIRLSSETTKKFNVLVFHDTASGIPSDKINRIFEPYYTDSGFGIGLSFCEATMKNFGGKISCNSQEGKYAEFRLYFPKHITHK